MSRAWILLLVLAAGCASQPEQSGPSTGDATVRGDPTSPRNRARVHTELGNAYFGRGNLKVALEELRIAIAADPGYAAAHGGLGLVYMALRENELAQRSFERALELAPGDPDINHNYGWFLCQTGRLAQARPYFRKALENPLYATPGRSYAAAGTCALQAGDLREAEQDLERAQRLEPGLVIVQLKLAEVRYRQRRYLDARESLARYTAVAPPSAEALWLGLRIERRIGARAAELSYANQLRRRFPASPEAQALQRGQYD